MPKGRPGLDFPRRAPFCWCGATRHQLFVYGCFFTCFSCPYLFTVLGGATRLWARVVRQATGRPAPRARLVARHARALIRRRASAGTQRGALHHGMLPGPHAKGCPCLPSPPSPGSSAGAPRGALGRCRPSPGPQSVVLLVGRRTVAKRQEPPLACASRRPAPQI